MRPDRRGLTRYGWQLRCLRPGSSGKRQVAGGFTLSEVLLASTIAVMITLVAVSALKAVSDTSQTVEKTTQATSEIRYAAKMIAHDMANFFRDPDPQNMLLVGASQESDSGGPPSLRFYTLGRVKARADQPEGDVYEVEYVLGPSKMTRMASNEEPNERTLYRRWWPNPDKRRHPGGILSTIAENIDVFQVRFHNGKEWVSEWTEESRELPQVMEVTLARVPQGRGERTVESFIVNFPRMPRGAPGSSGGPNSPDQSGGPEPQQGSSGGPSTGPDQSGQSGQPASPGGR
jgi:type II secretion system protein J